MWSGKHIFITGGSLSETQHFGRFLLLHTDNGLRGNLTHVWCALVCDTPTHS